MTVDLFRFSLAVCLGVISAAWFLVHQRARGKKDARQLEVVLGSQFFAVLGHFFENLSTTLSIKIFWDAIQLFFDGAMAAGYVLFAMNYVGRPPKNERRVVALLLAVPVFASLVMATAPLHGLVRQSARLVASPMLRLHYEFEWLDYLVFVEWYGIFFVTLGIFGFSGFLKHRVFRRQAFTLMLGSAFPASMVFVVGSVDVLGERDVSPYFFAAAALVNAFAVLREQVFKLAPLARDLLIERLGDAVIVIDREGHVVDANRAALPFFAEGSAVGRKLLVVWPGAVPPDGASPGEGRSGQPPLGSASDRAEGFRVELDGRVWEVRRHSLDDQGELLIGRDVTKLAAFEAELERANRDLEIRVAARTEELQSANKKFRAIFDNAHQSIVLCDAEARVLAVNLTALDMAALLAEDLIGKKLSETPFWQRARGADEILHGAWESARAGRFARFELVYDDSRYLHFDCSLKPIVEDGQVRVVLFEAHDISAVRQAERERLQLSAERQHAEQMRMLGRLAGAVAHDFNNLLTVMMAGTSVLRHRSQDAVTTEVLDDMEQVTESATLVTRQLLAFSRPSLGKVEPTDVNEVIERMSKIMVRLLGERHELVLALAGARPFVLMDGGQLERCLMNLVVNARDAMAEGGKIVVGTRVEHRAVSALGSGEVVVISVADSGEGMSEEVRGRVFEAFFTTKPSGKGTGLGLATVQQIVSSARGVVELESELGKGSTFELVLPLCDPERAADPSPPSGRTVGSETVALVEDVAALRELMGRELRRFGYDVHSFASAEQAKKGLEGRVRPAILVTDVILPKQSGVDLARDLEAQFPGLPVVFTTGYSGEAPLDDALEGKNRRVLFKPYPPLALALTIRQLLDDPGEGR